VGGFLHYIVEQGRGQSFAGHSLADIAMTGGAGTFLAGIGQFWVS